MNGNIEADSKTVSAGDDGKWSYSFEANKFVILNHLVGCKPCDNTSIRRSSGYHIAKLVSGIRRISGYTPVAPIETVITIQAEGNAITFYYTANAAPDAGTHTLTIHYVYENGTVAAPDHVEKR